MYTEELAPALMNGSEGFRASEGAKTKDVRELELEAEPRRQDVTGIEMLTGQEGKRPFEIVFPVKGAMNIVEKIAKDLGYYMNIVGKTIVWLERDNCERFFCG